MKINFLLTALIVSSFAAVPAIAGITPDEASSFEYLQNHGHSTSIVEMVQRTKAGTNGEQYVTLDEKRHANYPKPVKWIRNFFIYLDPALDDGSFMNHNSKPSPNIDDL